MRTDFVGSLIVGLVALAAVACATMPEGEVGETELPTLYGVPIRDVKSIGGKWDGRYYGGMGNATVRLTINGDGSYEAVTSNGHTYRGRLTVTSRPDGAEFPATYAAVSGEDDGSVKWEDNETTGILFLHQGASKRVMTGAGITRDGHPFTADYWPAKE